MTHYSTFDQGRKKHDSRPPPIGVNTFARRIASLCSLPAFAVTAFALILAFRAPDLRADVLPTYSVDFHAIGAGGTALRNNCFRLGGTLAQPVPGYSAASLGTPTYSVYAGFWSAKAATGPDDVFFAGFEAC